MTANNVTSDLAIGSIALTLSWSLSLSLLTAVIVRAAGPVPAPVESPTSRSSLRLTSILPFMSGSVTFPGLSHTTVLVTQQR